jgi:DNA repair and recombination protein RAD52
MMDWDQVSKDLEKKLDPAAVKPPPKGKFGEYVDAHHVISEANRIFGRNGWSYDITRLLETYRGEITLKGQNGDYKQFRCGYLCTVKVHVDGTFREAVGGGSGSGKPENIGDVLESAFKEAETDALKRALRSYGNTFGLALYDKTKSDVGIDKPPFDAPAATGRIIARLKKQTTDADLTGVLAEEREAIGHVKDASADDYALIVAASKACRESLKPKDDPTDPPF